MSYSDRRHYRHMFPEVTGKCPAQYAGHEGVGGCKTTSHITDTTQSRPSEYHHRGRSVQHKWWATKAHSISLTSGAHEVVCTTPSRNVLPRTRQAGLGKLEAWRVHNVETMAPSVPKTAPPCQPKTNGARPTQTEPTKRWIESWTAQPTMAEQHSDTSTNIIATWPTHVTNVYSG